MGINYLEFLDEVRTTISKARDAMSEIEDALVNNGFSVPHYALGNALNEKSASGRLFFERVWAELESSLLVVENLTELIVKGSGQDSKVALDEIALRQRKLFESFCAIVMLSRPEIYQSNQQGAYFYHFHLMHEVEYLRLRNVDLTAYFGGQCDTTARQRENRERIIQWLQNEGHVDPNISRWSTNNARLNFERAFLSCSAIEKTAIGFGYQQVFGTASSQVHMNLCGFYDPSVSERHFLGRVDSLLLLAVCTILRAIAIFERTGGQVDSEGASVLLRHEFDGAFPNQYASAALGSGELNDVVAVFEAPDIFLGQITAKKQGAEFVSYDITPILNIGRTGCFTDCEIMVVIRTADIPIVIQDAVRRDIITQEQGGRESLQALAILIRSQAAFDQILMPRMNVTNMPSLYFVQRYLERRKKREEIESRAYFNWIGRHGTHGNDLRDWFEAEREMSPRA